MVKALKNRLFQNQERFEAESIYGKTLCRPSIKGGLKMSTNGCDPLIKMAAMPICGKNT